MTNTEFDKIIKDSKSYWRIHDELTRIAIKEFMSTQITSYDEKVKLKHFLSAYPKRISVNEFTPEVLKETACIWNNSNRKLFINFLIFAQQRGYNTNEKIHRFTYFEGVSGRLTARVDYIFKVLEDDEFELFVKTRMFEELKNNATRPTMFVFCYEFLNLHFLDYRVVESVQALIHYWKYESNYSSIYLYNLLPALDNMIALLFSDSDELTLNKVKKIVGLIQGDSKGRTRRQDANKLFCLQEIIGIYYKNGLVKDSYITCIAELNTKKTLQCELPLLHKILDSKHPEYFTLYFPPKQKDLEHSLVLCINHPEPKIRDLLLSFITEQYPDTIDLGVIHFLEEFNDSLQGIKIITPNDFNYNSFLTQMFFYKEAVSIKGERDHTPPCSIIAFYLYIANNINDDLFADKGLPPYILNSVSSFWLLYSGYEIIKYNQFEDVPVPDKWILLYKKKSTASLYTMTPIDFTQIKSVIYRNWFKNYIWKYTQRSMRPKLKLISPAREGFNYLSEFKAGRINSIYQVKTVKDENHITAADTLALLDFVYHFREKHGSQSQYIYGFRSVFRHVKLNNLGIIDRGGFSNLKFYLNEKENTANPISDEELEELFKVINKRINETDGVNQILYVIYRTIICLALETEFRVSHILDLHISSIKETAKKGEYTIYDESKTHDEPTEQPITTYTKRDLEEIIKITETFREKNTQQHTKDFIFIGPKRKKNTYGQISIDTLGRFLKDSCKMAGIPSYTFSNLRDTHMTKAEEYKIYNKLSDLSQTVLTGHTSTLTDDRYYVKHDIRKMLEAVHGVIIGNVTPEGKICREINEAIVSDDDIVENGCGYCSSPKCNVLTPLGCLMCKDFVTIPQCIPFFEHQMQIVDKRIEASSVPHDKEDLVNMKRLLVRYMEELIAIQESTGNVEG